MSDEYEVERTHSRLRDVKEINKEMGNRKFTRRKLENSFWVDDDGNYHFAGFVVANLDKKKLFARSTDQIEGNEVAFMVEYVIPKGAFNPSIETPVIDFTDPINAGHLRGPVITEFIKRKFNKI